jgi:hypothetical protein
MPLVVPAWIAAIAAVVLAIGVSINAWLARKALNTQLRRHADLATQLTELLDLQGKELRQAMDERRRGQASGVYIELRRAAGDPPGGPWQVTACVHNTSPQPVYDLYVIWQLGTVRMGKPDPAPRLMPGQQLRFERGLDPATTADADAHVDPGSLSAFLTFRDSAGVRWTAREDGTFTDMSLSPRSDLTEHATQ